MLSIPLAGNGSRQFDLSQKSSPRDASSQLSIVAEPAINLPYRLL